LEQPEALVRNSSEARIITDSGLDWTIVRAATLTNGPRTGKYRASKLDGSAGSKIARADVADFMLASATNGNYVHSMPVISQ
jgi:putative NADH-flavin reductase